MKNTFAKLTSPVVDWLAGPRDALVRVRDAEAAKRREHTEAQEERSRLFSLLAPRDEIVARLDSEIGILARQWVEGRGMRLITGLSGTIDVGVDGVARGIVHQATLADLLGAVDLPMLCAMTPDLVRQSLAALITTTEYTPGPSMQDRVRLIAECDERVALIETQHGNLVATARELGLVMDDLPENRAKKIQAEQKRAREARALALNPPGGSSEGHRWRQKEERD